MNWTADDVQMLIGTRMYLLKEITSLGMNTYITVHLLSKTFHGNGYASTPQLDVYTKNMYHFNNCPNVHLKNKTNTYTHAHIQIHAYEQTFLHGFLKIPLHIPQT